MGLGRLLFWAIAGPMLMYFFLLGHVFCRMWMQEPEVVKLDDFPKSVSKADVDKIIATRKEMMKDIKEAVAGNVTRAFVDKHLTKDVEFEDFWMKYKGADEFTLLLEAGSRTVNWAAFHISAEHHGPNEFVVDWIQDMNTPFFTSNVAVPMRVHWLLRKDAQGKERIYRYYEEWWYNKQLNQETTFGPLGMVHEQLRWWTGRFLLEVVKAGYL